MTTQTQAVQSALTAIERAVETIENEADNYGGWPGEDEDSKTATELGLRLTGLAWPCAIGGREFAESGDRSWEPVR